jgi:hypothetical protein
MKTINNLKRAFYSALITAIGGIILVTTPEVVKGQETIRPFKIEIPESAITDLQQRIKATRWP